MGERSESTKVDVVSAFVNILRDLELELQAATNAVACNKLMDLEDSLWRQETLCVGLKRSIRTILPTMLSADEAGLVRERASRLKAQAEIYEKLVSRARRSTAILQHLCSLYRTAALHPGRTMYRSISREA